MVDPGEATNVAREFERRESLFVRVCLNCASLLGTVRCVLALKKCPECGTPIIPVESHTMSVLVRLVAAEPRDATAKEERSGRRHDRT